ncbi:MAG: cadherin-like beta sandwich domain-containing protein, partial [Bacilli bacterium]
MQIGVSEAVCVATECEASDALKNQTSYEETSMSVCYEYDGKGNFEVNGKDEKDIFKCASGYQRVIKPDFENDTCKELTDNDKAQSCYRTYTYTCNSVDKPKVHEIESLITSENVGTISIQGTDSATKTGLKGYIINLGEAVTRDSDWQEFENSEYIASVQKHTGTYFAWAMTNDKSISYPVMLRIHSEDLTTTAEVGLKGPNDDLTNSLSPLQSEDGLVYGGGVTSQKYVRLSNQLMNDSLIATGFDLFTTAYELTVDSDAVSLYATLTNSDAKYVEGYEPRTIDLDYGRNVAIIKIENNKGAQRSYTFVINRTDTRESVNVLKDVILGVGTINFDPYVSDYTVSIPKNTTSVSINGTLESDKSAFIAGYEPRTISLTEDVTSAVLKTISEAGITRNYVFTFIKTGAYASSSISSSTYLSSLTIPGTEISFNKENLSYSVAIEYEIESATVFALPESANATVEVKGSQGLKVGANKIEIVVTNGLATKIYNVFINRKEDGLGVSSNTMLETLTVKGYDINFNPDVEDYIIKIKREKTLLLTATPQSNRSEVYMYGNNDLTAFSTVRVKVIAENGDTGLYSVDIIKDVYNKKLETTLVIVGCIIILGSGIIILVSKRRKKLQNYIED